MKKTLGLAVATTTAALLLTACGGGGPAPRRRRRASKADNANKTITLWVAGGDTPKELRTYRKDTFKAKTGATLKIEEQGGGDIVTKLDDRAARREEHARRHRARQHAGPDLHQRRRLQRRLRPVRGARRRQAAPVLRRGRLGRRQEVRAAVLLRLALHVRPCRRVEGGRRQHADDLEEFNTAVKTITAKNPRRIKDFSGFFLGGQDWRNGISWIFANGGELAKKENGQWVSTLSDPNTIKGLTQLQDLYKNASKAPADAKDATPWLYINDSDEILDENQKVTGKTSLAAATIMAPGRAHWSIGDLVEKDGKKVREWNDATFATLVLPGNDGKPAPASPAAPTSGSPRRARTRSLEGPAQDHLLREYQQMLGKAGLGLANSTTWACSAPTSSPRHSSTRRPTPS